MTRPNRLIYCSPTEPQSLRDHYTVNTVPEDFGVDLFWSTPHGLLGVQRKTPEDLVASLRDGRISKQTAQAQALDWRYVMIEGYPPFTRDGEWLNSYVVFTRKQWHGTIYSLGYEGWTVIQTASRSDLIEQVQYLFEWSSKSRHGSLKGRTAPTKDSFRRVSNRAWAIHILTSLPGIGVGVAENIYDRFGRIPLRWDASRLSLLSTKGLGPKTLDSTYKYIPSMEGEEEYQEHLNVMGKKKG